MKSIFMNYHYLGFMVITMISIINVFGQDAIYVTKLGSPNPDGSAEKPYHVIQSAISKSLSSESKKIIIEHGEYYEKLSISTPCVVLASRGNVIIGKMDYRAITTFDVISLNTHLVGDEKSFPNSHKWRDYQRADDIADFILRMNLKPDIIGFQEIWDEDLFKGGDGANGIHPRTGYFYGKHGEIEGFDILNSGLAILSNYWLAGFKQNEFFFDSGWDRFAAKGWIQATVNKNGFGIGLFNLHTQAEKEYWPIRFMQILQLSDAIKKYRSTHPTNVVFVMGDFNIFGETAEYKLLIDNIGKTLGGYDSAANSPGFIPNCASNFTVSNSNQLGTHFYEVVEDGRLDYIFYFPSFDGRVEILPKEVRVLKFLGRNHCCLNMTSLFNSICKINEDPICITFPYTGEICYPTFCTTQSSDHWSVYGQFNLIRH